MIKIKYNILKIEFTFLCFFLWLFKMNSIIIKIMWMCIIEKRSIQRKWRSMHSKRNHLTESRASVNNSRCSIQLLILVYNQTKHKWTNIKHIGKPHVIYICMCCLFSNTHTFTPFSDPKHCSFRIFTHLNGNKTAS